MNTTVTVETVHGLKDTFVVGSAGVVLVHDTTSEKQDQAAQLNGQVNGQVSDESAPTQRPSAK